MKITTMASMVAVFIAVSGFAEVAAQVYAPPSAVRPYAARTRVLPRDASMDPDRYEFSFHPNPNLGKTRPDPKILKAIAAKDYPYLLKRYASDCEKAVAKQMHSRNLPTRVTNYERAEQQAKGCHALGQMYEKSEGTEIDTGKARDLYIQSARLGLSDSQDAAVRLSPDPVKARETFALDPLMGFDHRCYSTRKLAMMYSTGDGVPKDAAQALKWNRLCYDTAGKTVDTYLPGYVLAGAMTLVDQYLSDDPTLRNPVEALSIVERLVNSTADLADKNRSWAQYRLAMLLISGEAGQKDSRRGLGLLNRAAEGGRVEAMMTLSDIYARGDGVTADAAKSADWFAKAEAANAPEARYLRGLQAYTSKDLPGAKGWWLKAAIEGHRDAQYAVAQYFLNDTAKTPNDLANAYVWFDLAARNKHPEAATVRDALRVQMDEKLLNGAIAAKDSLIRTYPKAVGDRN